MSLRSAEYTFLWKQLEDLGHNENDIDGVQAGRLFILPSTYVEGHGYMQQNTYNIIFVSNKVGYSNIFLTVKCNP